jgi:hypothetical protein
MMADRNQITAKMIFSQRITEYSLIEKTITNSLLFVIMLLHLFFDLRFTEELLIVKGDS